MNVKIDSGAILRMAIFLAGIGLVLFLGMQGNGPVKIVYFIRQSAVFSLQCGVITLIALMIVYLSQCVRNTSWFDSKGAAEELSRVRDRLMTPNEMPNDALAASIQYGTTTLFVGMIILSFFIVLAKSG